MNTNIINNIRKTAIAAVASLGAMTFTSCGDFLDILPLNEVVLENYWTEENDVTSVLNSCYESLESQESMLRMGIWGEMRSDNIIPGRQPGYDVSEMMKENILPTNSLVKWDIMYQTINRCNVVIYYAPSVQEKDPNYTYDELQANIAEATFIRDLCYFYLLRTYRDVPMVFEPSIDDLKDYRVPPTKFDEGIKILIEDLKKVENSAVRRYIDDTRMTNSVASSQAYPNSSRVTRLAIYALIADLSLWAGDYQQACNYADKVIEYKKNQYKEKKQQLGNISDMALFHDIPLILDKPTGSTTCGNLATELYGDKNSFESLFELYFRTNQGMSNNYVNDYYRSSSQTGYFAAPALYRNQVPEDKNNLFAKDDGRAYENIAVQSNSYYIVKYAASRTSWNPTNITSETSVKATITMRGNAYSNWIVYRLTEVMLIKAEALIMLGGDENMKEAFALISAVNNRARSITNEASADALKYTDYDTQEKMMTLLFDERNREFMFEGKRWYDLVRISLRDGNTKTLVSKVTVVEGKYAGQNSNAIKVKLADPNIIFLPYYREELKLNPYLRQNSAYSDSEDYQM